MRTLDSWFKASILSLVLLFFSSNTSVLAQTSFRFVSMGDSQDNNSDLSVTANQANSLNPAFVIFNGDLENDGVTLDRMNSMTSALGGLLSKTFLVRGNHDNHVTGSAALWQNYFLGLNRPVPSGVTNYVGLDSNSTYLSYSFDYGNSRFIGIDGPGSASTLTSSQYTFMDQRLTDAEAKGLTHAFIFFHGPEYCVESVHCTCTAANDAKCTPVSFVNLINKHPIVTATFHGHEHILGWVHMDSSRVSSLTHSYEEFITSPSTTYNSYNKYMYPARMDYYYPNVGSGRGFATVDVNDASFTFSIYLTGNSSPVWSRTFTKSAAPVVTPTPSTPTPAPNPTATPRPTVAPTPTPIAPPPAGKRVLKYYGVDRGNPINETNYSTLSQYSVKTMVVDVDINNYSSWSTIASLASKYNFNVVIWPSDWENHETNWPNCGWEAPYVKNNPGDYIYKVKPVLDYFYNPANWPGGNVKVIGIVNAHEPTWSCFMTIKEMSDIRTQLKSYTQSKFGRDIQVWNYIDNVTDLAASGNVPDYTGLGDIGKIMDVAVTWQHCFGGAEGTCQYAQQKIINDRNAINAAGLDGKLELVYLFQTFATGGSYRMPTASEMQEWSCTFLGSDALDGFMWYTWGACWYASDLYCPVSTHPNQNLWPVMNTVYNSCVNKGTSNPTPAPSPSPVPNYKGDANGDGSVNEADYLIWVSYFKQTITGGASVGDFDRNGTVDGLDYVIWLNTYGK